MTNDVATLQSVQDKVKERIQASFMDLLPPELFDSMVKAELHNFTKNLLPDLIRAQAKQRAIDLLQAEFSKPEWGSVWSWSNEAPGEAVQNAIKEAAPDLVAALFGGVVQQMVNHLRNGGLRF